jgi:chromosome segregation ATPase
MKTEELMFLHSKFHASTKEHLESHQASIVNLEERLSKLKEELRSCYDYKNKLEHERERSKQIISTLMTMF